MILQILTQTRSHSVVSETTLMSNVQVDKILITGFLSIFYFLNELVCIPVLKYHGSLYANKYQQTYQQISKHCLPKYLCKLSARDISHTKLCTEFLTQTNTIRKAKSNIAKAPERCIQALLMNTGHKQKPAAHLSAVLLTYSRAWSESTKHVPTRK